MDSMDKRAAEFEATRKMARQTFEVYAMIELVSVAKKLGVAEAKIVELENQRSHSDKIIGQQGRDGITMAKDLERMGADLAKRRKGDAALAELYRAAAELFKKPQGAARNRARARLAAAIGHAHDHVDLIPF